MLDAPRLVLFRTAASLLAIAPGPKMLYVLARSLAGGTREGVLSAFRRLSGRSCACLRRRAGGVDDSRPVHGGVLGGEIRWRGLSRFSGYQDDSGRRRENFDPETISPLRNSGRHTLWQGVATEVLNPKTAVFFLS